MTGLHCKMMGKILVQPNVNLVVTLNKSSAREMGLDVKKCLLVGLQVDVNPSNILNLR